MASCTLVLAPGSRLLFLFSSSKTIAWDPSSGLVHALRQHFRIVFNVGEHAYRSVRRYGYPPHRRHQIMNRREINQAIASKVVDFTFAVRQGDADLLAKLEASGTVAAIKKKWGLD